MRRKAWITLVAAALVSAAAGAQMGPGPYGPGYGSGYGYGRGMGPGMMAYGGGAFAPGGCGLRAGLAEELGLTEAQRTSIAAIFEETWPQRLALMDEMHELRGSRWRDGGTDYTRIASVRDRMLALNQGTRERVDAVLTPEQRERMDDAWWGFGGRWR